MLKSKIAGSLFGYDNGGGKLQGRFSNVNRRVTATNTKDYRPSMYNENPGVGITLSPALIKALWIYLGLEKRNYALGKLANGLYAAELESQTATNLIQMVTYDSTTGKVQASCRKMDTQTDINYNFNDDYSKDHPNDPTCHNTDGTAIWLVLMPEIFKDDEAIKAKGEIQDILSLGLNQDAENEQLIPPLTLFCDNVYRRATKNLGDANLILENIGEKGPLKVVSGNKIAAARDFAVRDVIAGAFQVFSSPNGVIKKVEIPEGKYNLGIELNDVQKQFVRPLPDGHVSSAVEVEILDTIKTGYENPVFKVSNFLLIGPPGTGKSQTAIAVAHHLGLPYFTVICSDGMTEDDFRGAIYPSIGGHSPASDATSPALSSVKMSSMPDELEIRYEPEKAYKKLTGKEKANVRPAEVMDIAYAIMHNRCTQLEDELSKAHTASESGLEYIYVPSPVVQAFQYGGVLEIQEPSAIMSQTVLTYLNDIMNSEDGILMTPYGPIKRHPNCIVIATNNPDSDEGYKTLNQAVKDRFQHIYTVDLPPKSVMVDRVMEKGISSDTLLLTEMAEVIEMLAHVAKEKRIKGTAGMRSYIEWCKAVACGISLRKSIEICVINKMTTNEKERDILLSTVEDNSQIFKRDIVK